MSLVCNLRSAVQIIVLVGLLGTLEHINAQNEQEKGWLEGTVTEPLHKRIDWQIDLYIGGQKVAHGASVPNEGDLFSIQDLKPGVYEVRVWTGFSGTGIRPQRLFGVVIKPGVRSVLPIKLHTGDTLEEIGQPAVLTEQIIIVSEALAKLQREIDELKKK